MKIASSSTKDRLVTRLRGEHDEEKAWSDRI